MNTPYQSKDSETTRRSLTDLTDAQKTFLRIVVIAGIVGLLFVFGSVSCPFQALFGIPCAGCGMTRAWQSAFRLDFETAFVFHPLFWTVPFIVIFGLCRPLINKKLFWAVAFLTAFVFIAVWLFRLFFLDVSFL